MLCEFRSCHDITTMENKHGVGQAYAPVLWAHTHTHTHTHPSSLCFRLKAIKLHSNEKMDFPVFFKLRIEIEQLLHLMYSQCIRHSHQTSIVCVCVCDI